MIDSSLTISSLSVTALLPSVCKPPMRPFQYLLPWLLLTCCLIVFFIIDETLARCRYEAEIAPVIVQPVSPVGRTDPPLEIIAEVVPKSVLPLHVQSAARGTAPENRNLETPQPPEVQLVVQPVLEMESVAPAVDDAIQHRPVVEPFEKEAAPFVTADVGRPADTVANNSVTATLEVAVSTSAQGMIQPTKQIEEIVLPKQVQGIRESALPVGPNSVQLQPETVAPAVIITTTVPAVPEHIMTNIPTVPQHIMAASDDVATVTAPPQNVVTDELIPVAAPSQNLMAAVDEVILMAAANVIPVTPTVDINALRGAQQRDGQIPQGTPAPTTPAHDRRQIAGKFYMFQLFPVIFLNSVTFRGMATSGNATLDGL